MPVTKKKGAIFPIYADTPPRAGPAPREEPAPPRDGRRALANIEPAPVRRKTSASPSSKRRALTPRSPTRSTRTKMDVFVDPDAQMDRPKRSALASKPLMSKPLSKSSSGKPLASKPLASKSLSQSQSQSQSLNPHASSSSLSKPPVKRRTRTPMDKENAVLPDSPASRTRSKLRLPDEPKSKPKTARAFTVFTDPLADVSEAYGATGEEPEGFREQGTSRKAIRS
ncbi:hypothetical protein CcaverHIS002_0507410 [Cutaneotrichosporon cavernicola]|uniref:Uncharacterized protein n=1 Tax=Cutaneotrichosporon cavernicola TaxID=279322 RepID=A0AA48QXC7_9TREE|nr:uncharacterized protein CcaverHIS019_0507950 [Cutaneotrichosporon cavernicola]BEI85340.1 hypothetical protein CcaverHIS002_0507410 [Cutaneotrichosporon cavernicola]BEI93167.1 hypothetical protein CcaverHIS019_0507950 [Cutaneotrichosporon cavernicola]BEJ00945.1 hypothetical protein CcaverHIS631_0508020 [Cutaneotrichosporon cavernicola]BEJ08710.1 hypothetical protein CcaverHIS641_0508040 [Cutaneotrichosporon cavernicola]